MATRPPPPALEPYLRLPSETSLILLTGTLACSANWLTSRYIASALSQTSESETDSESRKSVLLISWLRDLTFWKSELRRTTGLDITRQTSFKFIDAFTTAKDLQSIESEVLASLPQNEKTTLLLVLDAPDTHLATSPTQSQSLSTFLLTLRSKAQTTILSSHADLPFLQAASGGAVSTPLEIATASFLTAQAHAARFVMGVRELDTGAARDVSGVLRVTRGGDCEAGEDAVEEKEMLYLVSRDGSVKIFGRGEGVE